MSGTPPPNYNPNDSLLSGGDSAKIIPVQGGGSLTDVPNSYNPDASLLSGGETAKIIPVQGGGTPPGVNPLPSVPESNNENNGASAMTGNEEDENNGASTMTGNEEEGEGNTEEDTEEENNNTGTTNATQEEEVSNEVPCPEPDSKTLEDLADSFEPSEDATETKRTETIHLNAKEFVIRKPKPSKPGSEEEDEVMADWKSLVFTEMEAEFLNTLGLSPKLLFTSFYCLDKQWEDELSQFLYYLTVLTCYPARFVITKGECQQVREFLEIVESNMKAQKIRNLSEQPIPVVGPIQLSELGEEEEEKNEEEENKEENEKEEPNAEGNNSHEKVAKGLAGLKVDAVEKKSLAKKISRFFAKFFPGKKQGKDLEDRIENTLEELENERDENQERKEEGEEEVETAEQRKAKLLSAEKEEKEKIAKTAEELRKESIRKSFRERLGDAATEYTDEEIDQILKLSG